MAFIAPTAAFVTGGSALSTVVSDDQAAPEPAAAADAALCCLQVVAMPVAPVAQTYAVISDTGAVTDPPPAASRWRVVDTRPALLAAGVASERNLQVKTILLARAISAAFPEVGSIGGYRADPLQWHPAGLAVDVMIPDPGSAAGIDLGNRVVAFALRNANRLGIQDAIWRGGYFTPGGGRQPGSGHFDHVHITTSGGGYPTGSEIYYR